MMSKKNAKKITFRELSQLYTELRGYGFIVEHKIYYTNSLTGLQLTRTLNTSLEKINTV